MTLLAKILYASDDVLEKIAVSLMHFLESFVLTDIAFFWCALSSQNKNLLGLLDNISGLVSKKRLSKIVA